MGLVPSLSAFFSTIPHSVGNTVLFVAYLQLFRSAFRNIEGFTFHPKTVYRVALPALLGLSIMGISTKSLFNTPRTRATVTFQWVAHGDISGTFNGILIF